MVYQLSGWRFKSCCSQLMKQYGNRNKMGNQQKISKMGKIVKDVLFIFPFLLKNLSLSDPLYFKEADTRLGKLKCDRSDMTHLMITIHHVQFQDRKLCSFSKWHV